MAGSLTHVRLLASASCFALVLCAAQAHADGRTGASVPAGTRAATAQPGGFLRRAVTAIQRPFVRAARGRYRASLRSLRSNAGARALRAAARADVLDDAQGLAEAGRNAATIAQTASPDGATELARAAHHLAELSTAARTLAADGRVASWEQRLASATDSQELDALERDINEVVRGPNELTLNTRAIQDDAQRVHLAGRGQSGATSRQINRLGSAAQKLARVLRPRYEIAAAARVRAALLRFRGPVDLSEAERVADSSARREDVATPDALAGELAVNRALEQLEGATRAPVESELSQALHAAGELEHPIARQVVATAREAIREARDATSRRASLLARARTAQQNRVAKLLRAHDPATQQLLAARDELSRADGLLAEAKNHVDSAIADLDQAQSSRMLEAANRALANNNSDRSSLSHTLNSVGETLSAGEAQRYEQSAASHVSSAEALVSRARGTGVASNRATVTVGHGGFSTVFLSDTFTSLNGLVTVISNASSTSSLRSWSSSIAAARRNASSALSQTDQAIAQRVTDATRLGRIP